MIAAPHLSLTRSFSVLSRAVLLTTGVLLLLTGLMEACMAAVLFMMQVFPLPPGLFKLISRSGNFDIGIIKLITQWCQQDICHLYWRCRG